MNVRSKTKYMKKITDNKFYNVYVYNNSGMFVSFNQYCVGEEDWKDELKLGTYKEIAIEVANKLNTMKYGTISKNSNSVSQRF